MTDTKTSPHGAALQELEAALEKHRAGEASGDAAAAAARSGERRRNWRPGWRLPFNPLFMFDRRHPVIRRTAIGGTAALLLILLAAGVIWVRLGSGPIVLDLATPWLTAAIEENFGNRYKVRVGGTQLERDAQGRTQIRLRDVTVLENGRGIVALAPKAEVGLSGTSLLTARPRAASLRLVDANMQIRVEQDGRVNVFAGGNVPLHSIAPVDAAGVPTSNVTLQSVVERSTPANVVALMAWIDRGLVQGGTGFDGQDLTELGITNGRVTIDDRRNGQTWSFDDISLRLVRPPVGGVAMGLSSAGQGEAWQFNAALTPHAQGHRLLQLEARNVLVDDLLALRMSDGKLRSDTRVTGVVRADIRQDGRAQTIAGTLVAAGGSIGALGHPETRIPIRSAEFQLDWDLRRGSLRVPFKVNSGAARSTLRAEFAPDPGGNWRFVVGGGWILLDPLTPNESGMVLKRVLVRGQVDTARQRIAFEQADFGTRELGGESDPEDVSLALSGHFDYSGEPRLALGLAATPMTVASFKRVWPAFIAPPVRQWALDHMLGGQVERVDIALNAPWATLQPGGPPVPDDGLAVEIVTKGTSLRPVAGLPDIRDADITARITGRTATVTLGKGTVDVSPGRRLALSNAVFEVPDTSADQPPARVRFRAEGPIPAAAELLALERLRDFSGTPFDPATTRGAVSAQVALAMPLRLDLPRGATTYNLSVELSHFSADRLMMGQRIEAQVLRVTANNQGFQVRGDVRVAGSAAQIEYRKASTEPDAELRIQASLDEAARSKLGLDFGTSLTGSIPVRLIGRVGAPEQENRFNVEADLTPVRIEQLLPGWSKPAGKPAKVSFLLIRGESLNRFDDVVIEGPGLLARGVIEVDNAGQLQSVSFPIYAASDGDKMTLKAERAADGALRVTVRGDVFDGRTFVKHAMAGSHDPKAPPDPRNKPKQADVDLDIKIGVVAGHHGETLRSLDLQMSRRSGRIRAFSMNGKIGRDSAFSGEMRVRAATTRPVLFFETADAGALFRFTDVYPRMSGGRIWVAMDPPTQEQTPQEGLINIRDFVIRDESALDRVVSQQQGGRNQVEFSQARAEFIKAPGRLSVREGLVRGPMIGATIEGNIDYARDQVAMRGTLVPLYGINNMFGQIPIVGLFLGGGSKEGLLGITYEVSGTPGNPRAIVNPLSAIAPGLLRKFFEFRDTGNEARSFAEPTR